MGESGDIVDAEYIDIEPKFERWSWEKHFRNYLLMLAKKGDKGLESLKNYPSKVDLGPDINEVLDRCRKETETGDERYGLSGADADGFQLFVSQKFWKGNEEWFNGGLRKMVPGEVVYAARVGASEKGLEVILGDIHSHPWSMFEGMMMELGIRDLHYFSAPDILGLLKLKDVFRMLVTGNQNLLIMKSVETAATVKDLEMSGEEFENYWFDKVTGVSQNNWGATVNKKICEAHRLVLYKGKRGKELHRIFP